MDEENGNLSRTSKLGIWVILLRFLDTEVFFKYFQAFAKAFKSEICSQSVNMCVASMLLHVTLITNI